MSLNIKEQDGSVIIGKASYTPEAARKYGETILELAKKLEENKERLRVVRIQYRGDPQTSFTTRLLKNIRDADMYGNNTYRADTKVIIGKSGKEPDPSASWGTGIFYNDEIKELT